jgi:Xaa-Pro aminopeptidase
LDEYIVTIELEKFRREQTHFKGKSFITMSSIGENGAMIHYKAKSGQASLLNNCEMYLLDSGGQYLYNYYQK